MAETEQNMKLKGKTYQGSQLAPGDVDILETLSNYRVVTLKLLSVILKRAPKRLHYRLSVLRKMRLVSSTPYLAPHVGRLPHLFYLTQSGMKILGQDDEEGMRVRTHELSPLWHMHWMGVSEIHALFELGCERTGMELVRWEQHQHRLRDSIGVTISGKRDKLSVQPDAFFTVRLPEQQKLFHFFLEYDRATTTGIGQTHSGKFLKKTLAYLEWWRAGGHTKKFGIKAFRVLTITRRTHHPEGSWERAKNLCKAAREADPEKKGSFLFWFTSLNEVTFEEPERLLKAPIWITSRDFDQGVMHALFGEG